MGFALAVQPLTSVDAAVLMHLYEQAEAGTGWCRHGVRGWRFRLEVEHVFPAAMDGTIRELRRRGFLDAAARVPHQHPGDLLFRISPAAVEVIGGATIPPPNFDHQRDSFFLQYGTEWTTLEVYRAVQTNPAAPVRFRRRGWLTALEARRFGPTNAHSAIKLTHLGLIERRRVDGVVYSRATKAAHDLVIVADEWAGAEAIAHVEVASRHTILEPCHR